MVKRGKLLLNSETSPGDRSCNKKNILTLEINTIRGGTRGGSIYEIRFALVTLIIEM